MNERTGAVRFFEVPEIQPLRRQHATQEIDLYHRNGIVRRAGVATLASRTIPAEQKSAPQILRVQSRCASRRSGGGRRHQQPGVDLGRGQPDR
jgi:hypothetical protein